MRLLSLLVSTRVTLVLLLTFAAAMGVATFIENDHGTAVARGLVYDAWWMEIIMTWMAVNFLFHIRHYKLFSSNRWPIGVFHLAFIIILIGAAITRYASEEGMMHIREGESAAAFFTTKRYVQLEEEGANGFVRQVPLALHAKDFKANPVKFAEAGLSVTPVAYIPNARQAFAKGNHTYVDMAVAIGGDREDYLIDEGRYIQMGEITLTTEADPTHHIQLFKRDHQWHIASSTELQIMDMSTQELSFLHKGEVQQLRMMTLYQWNEGAFMVKGIHENAKLEYLEEEVEEMADNLLDVVKFSVSDAENRPVYEFYSKLVNLSPTWSAFEYEGRRYAVTYGPKLVPLPFSLYLNAFELERYPGSQSPASYASEVMVMDQKEEFPYRIFMNNVLDYRGFRFYQASFDSDERGTILSVNQDRPGTYVTYFGYFLLTLGMFITLFSKGSRFHVLGKKLANLSKQVEKPTYSNKKGAFQAAVLGGTAMALLVIFAQTPRSDKDSFSSITVPLQQADSYGKLIVQDLDGRMKPLNTLANEITRKITGKSSVLLADSSDMRLKWSPEQFLLAAQLDPVAVSGLPLIKIHPKKTLPVFNTLSLSPTDRLSFNQFLDGEGNYLIQHLVEEANKLKPSERSESHNEILKVDERFNIMYGLLTGDFLRLFPNMQDRNNTWFTSAQYMHGFSEEDAMFVKNIIPLYVEALNTGLETGDWTSAEETLAYISLYQEQAGSEVYPPSARIQGELLYNQLNLGSRLFVPFWLLGLAMLVLSIWNLLAVKSWIAKAWAVGKLFSWIGLGIFTFHLALRWYIAEHPPWSDGFEMLVFVAWGVLLMGLAFGNKSKFTIPLSLLFSGTLLFVGFLDWLNPEITNLMPVLHSYWLKIHVAIIVSGYAPLALAAVLSLLSLLMIAFKPTASSNRWLAGIRELSIVSELSINIGLFLLTVGTFLGGVWANESWGRYWAWDPKETWALISIIVYAIVVHLRLIPALKNSLLFTLASLWAFSSIVMTSFGVNYYLSGLHSYASGDPVPIPQWVYWAIAMLVTISAMAIFRHTKLSDKEKSQLAV